MPPASRCRSSRNRRWSSSAQSTLHPCARQAEAAARHKASVRHGGLAPVETASHDVAHVRHIVEPMAVADREERARGSFERRMWGDAFADLSAAHREGQLDGRGSRAPCGLPHTWSGETTRAKRPGSPPTTRGCAAAKRSAPHAVRSGRRSGSSSGATWLRRWAGSPAVAGSWRRAVATASSTPGCGCSPRCRACSRETQSVLFELRRGGGDRRALRRCRRVDVRAARPRVRADPAGTSRRGHGAAGRGHGLGHRRRGVADARGHRLLPGDRPVSGGVRSPSREGVDGGAHSLVRCAARHRSVPRQLSRPSLRDLSVAGRVDATPWNPPAERASGSPAHRHGTRSDRPTTSWPRSSGCAASSRRQRSPIAEPAWRDGTPSRGCPCSAWRRGESISLFRRSVARSTRRRIRSLGHACYPPVSRSCSRPTTSGARGRRPMSLPGSPRSSTPPYLNALAAEASGAVLLAEGDPRAALTTAT